MTRASSSPPAPPAPPAPRVPMQQPVAPPPSVGSCLAQPSKPTLFEAIAAASPSFGPMIKDSKNSFTNSPYQKLPALLEAVKPPLLEQGVVIYSAVTGTPSGWVVRTTLALLDDSQEISSDFPIPDCSGVETFTKSGAVIKSPSPASRDQIGAAITYGIRYNLYALLAVCPVEDDDGASGYTASGASSHGLPGLPGSPSQPMQSPQPAWPQPGLPAQSVPVPQFVPMAPAIGHPVQPHPVLPQ
jgi:hypothetical protein